MHLHIYNHYFLKVDSFWSYLLIFGMIITTIEGTALEINVTVDPEVSEAGELYIMHYQNDNVLEKNKIMETLPPTTISFMLLIVKTTSF